MKLKKGQEVWTGSEAQQREYAKNNPTKNVTPKAKTKPKVKPTAARPKKK